MLTAAKQTLSVGELVTQFKSLAEMSFPDVWVEGEVSQVSSPTSGHIYFTLKDDSSLLRCVLFKNKRYQAVCLPEEGKTLLIRGKVSVYTQRCELQFIASYIEDAGEGALRREFELLKNKLQSQGLFEQAHKKAIPRFPQKIAVITSASAAALQDVLSTLQKRFPIATVCLCPATVQGDRAAIQIMAALDLAQAIEPDIILLVRGGGSAEDLHAFNDEQLAQHLYDCPIAVISGVGHETDFTIADFVADQRALTPTDAAVLATPDQSELSNSIAELSTRLSKLTRSKISERQQTKDYLLNRVKHPKSLISTQRQRIDGLITRLRLTTLSQLNQKANQCQSASIRLDRLEPSQQISTYMHRQKLLSAAINQMWQRHHERKQQRVNLLLSKLNTLNPLSTLDRGYAIVQNQNGHLISQTSQISETEVLNTRLASGSFQSKVTVKEPS